MAPGPGDELLPAASFQDMQLPGWLKASLPKLAFSSPLPVQAQACPVLLEGHDLVCIAPTGSGKTLAFLLPMISLIDELWQGTAESRRKWDEVRPLGLVLAPTRELAIQIRDEAAKLTDETWSGWHQGRRGISTAYACGGERRAWQLEKLQRGCDILTATPGRLADYVKSNEVSLRAVRLLVLDEADIMLDEGFGAELATSFQDLPENRQVCFFSATWPSQVQDLARRVCTNGRSPMRVAVAQRADGEAVCRPDIEQEVVVFDGPTWEANDVAKRELLCTRLRQILSDKSSKVLVFANTRDVADSFSWKLSKEGFPSEAIHGHKQQSSRTSTLHRFRKGPTRLLIATDVMGRGIDVTDVTHVVIYDMCEIENYVHRVGRTARGLSKVRGRVLTFFELGFNNWSRKSAGDLIRVLEASNQPVPEALYKHAAGVQQGGWQAAWKRY